ncbi:MAG: hypothetical protein COW00_07120 [Bdellovibrio sp. CG12_big_fil_rev_8_21_14_0_65_39_13]|nr:MAG: hypothetical protein COW78_03245 [Bdellovibrio sp. CG22_combo_CG10-13_8_21_14_all_39_27]PIQ60370.1 MAG: hypothetical protein COW00_07120 [Bdellovibrio sp. CG12_big_fil_rev_8_21_14_0_65_39_13]PIR35021.1 MAG: hypothetical protein COV37_10340 [Bdellovibrio sp. CG11_big_fil_rev_8_21_14_0_20_39_38]PJB54291.1 MAG: hypothetical protein CO099_02425 [Bdellovibrio sp. CG_4_9_14_3_um_filter_39_7]
MKKALALSILATTLSISQVVSAEQTYVGSNFNSVWAQVTSDAYAKPQNKISFGSLVEFGVNKIKNSAERTLSDHSDILPQFNKLAHPNGICLKGTWEIDQENIYSGLFKNGSKAMIIARASTAMSTTKAGETRAFGLAGKIFSQDEVDQESLVPTANFFLVDDLGGTKAKHYTDVAMTNEPAVSKTFEVIKNLAYALKLASTFGKADENPGMRQMYEISEMDAEGKVITPKWMKIQARAGQTINKSDFRDELNVKNYNNHLVFDISVANSELSNGQKDWERIGSVTFEESVVSNSCDHRLHFHHPKWRKDLKHKL